MPVTWEDVAARARGLSTHLLDRHALEQLGRARDAGALVRAFEEAGIGCEAATPAALERAVRRRAARWLAVLARWAGPPGSVRQRALAPLLDDEDRRSVRALLRGAAAGAPPEARVAAALPTPTLPEPALRELAAQPTPGALVALLAAWRHPFAEALREEARRPHADLLRLDVALTEAWAARARTAIGALSPLSAARRDLAAWTGATLDVENALCAIVLAGQHADVDESTLFVDGGARLSREAFVAAAMAPDAPTAARLLADGALASTTLGAALAEHADAPAALEDAALGALVAEQARRARLAPVGLAPILAFVLRARAEARDLRRIVWSVALAAPAPPLVTAA